MVSRRSRSDGYNCSHVVMVIAVLLLVLTLKPLATEVDEELAKLDDDETPGSVAPTRTARTKFAPGT